MKTKLFGTAVTLLLILLLFPHGLVAQEAPGVPPLAAGADEKNDDAPLREQTIYIPFSKLRESFEKEGRGVFLPYEQFDKLWKAARAKEHRVVKEGPAVSALIAEVANTATVEQDVVRVVATLSIEILKEGWHEVPLRLADAAISRATIDGQPARIVPARQGGYKLIVNNSDKSPQRLELILDYSKAYTKAPGQNSVSLQAPQAPVNRWQIRIPQSGVKVNVHPMIAASEVPARAEGDDGADDDGETVVQAFVGAAPTVRIDWTPKSEGAAGLAALAAVQTRQENTIEEGVIHTRAVLTYEISRADLSQLRIEVPADHRVAGVFDPNVRQWEVEKLDDVQRITVQLFEPTRGRQNVTIQLEKFSGDLIQDDVTVPVVKALDVGRQQGSVAVRLDAGLRGKATTEDGLLQEDPSEFSQQRGQAKWSFAYRYATVPFKLQLSVEKVQPRVQVDQLVEAYLTPEQLTVTLFAVYNIERAGVFQLNLQVPPGFEVRHVRGHAGAGAQAVLVDTDHLQGNDNSRLLVNLGRKASGKVGLLVELQRRLDDPNLLSPTGESSQIPLTLPSVVRDGIERVTGRLVVYKPESLRVNPSEQEGLRSVSFAEAYQAIPTVRDNRFPQTQPALAYAFTGDDVKLSLNVQRRKPLVTARQLLVTQIETGQVKYEAKFFYTIRYSGVKSLRIDVPAELAADIRNDTPAIRETRMDPAPDDVADGYIPWSFTGETELLGDVTIRLAWEQKVDELDVGKAVKLKVPSLRPMTVNRAWGQILITKSETIDIRPAGTPEGLRPIDPQHDVLPQDRVAGAAGAFEFQDDWNLELQATRYELEEVKQTSIESAVIRQVVTRSDKISVQALYRMRSARQRLAITLPADVSFAAQPLRINGKAVPLERGDDDALHVPLVGQNADKLFLLELRYSLPGTGDNLQLPNFPDEPAVQKVYLCAYLPEDLALLGSRGAWTDQQPPWWEQLRYGVSGYQQTDGGLIQQVTRGVDVAGDPAENFQTDGTLYVFSTLRPAEGEAGALQLVTMKADRFQTMAFVLIAVLGLILLFRPVSNKLVALALLIIALILVGVFLPTLSQQILQGVLPWAVSIVLIVWAVWFVVHDLPRHRAAAAAIKEAEIVAAPPPPRPEEVAAEPAVDAKSDEPAPAAEPPEEESADDDSQNKEGGSGDA